MAVKLKEHHVERLERFLTKIEQDTYPEPVTSLHEEIIVKMVPEALKLAKLPAGAKVLDVGCGQGSAMQLFAQAGLSAVGITINDVDIQACRAKGLDVREMDQSFLEFDDASFDLVWCRHCLEHSVMPYFTLSEFARVLRPGGTLYVEVPAPDTPSQHGTNRNHYSVLPKSGWISLIQRAGFDNVLWGDIPINMNDGSKDLYWCFFGTRAAR